MARCSMPPKRDMKKMTDSWKKPVDTDGPGISESRLWLKHNELEDLHDGKVRTVKTADMKDRKAAANQWPLGLAPSDQWGEVCGECFCQKAVNGDCMC